MITSSNERSNRQRNFEIAVLASFALHFVLGLLVVNNWHRVARAIDQSRETIATVDTIRIERRRIVPPPAHPHVVRPQPAPPKPVTVDPVIPALPVPRALEAPPKPQRHERSEVSHLALHAPPKLQSAAGSPKRAVEHFDEAQLSQLQNEFKQAITQAQAQQSAAQTVSAADPVAPKRYAMSFSGIHDNLRHGEGTIDGCRVQNHGKDNYHYYCHYEYMYPDGHVEQDTIPWPQIYPADNDPLMARRSRVNILPPPADFRPDRPLQPLLRAFFTGEQLAP